MKKVLTWVVDTFFDTGFFDTGVYIAIFLAFWLIVVLMFVFPTLLGYFIIGLAINLFIWGIK